MNKTIYLVILNLNTVKTVFCSIDEAEVKEIREAIDAEDDDEIVVEFMSRNGHRESDCQYMFSDKPIVVEHGINN
jgi:hypothetical protein